MKKFVDKPIVVVDDDQRFCRLMTQISRQTGVTILSASDVKSFDILLAEHQPSFVIIDLNLGADAGEKVIEKLREDEYVKHVAIASGCLRSRTEAAVEIAKNTRLWKVDFWQKPLRVDFVRKELSLHKLLAPHRIAQDLRHAIKNDKIHLEFQPKLRLPDMRISGFEALARWDDVRRGSVSPDIFVDVARKSSLGKLFAYDVIEKACGAYSKFREHDPAVEVSVNIDMSLLEDSLFSKTLLSIMKRRKVPAAGLKIELTEQTQVRDENRAIESANILKSKGLRLSLDDYGFGHSSIYRLKTYPFDEVKIDRNMISNLRSNRKDQLLVKSIIGMAHSLDMEVVAEGVEDLETALWLKDTGVDYLQGFFIGSPLRLDRALIFHSCAAHVSFDIFDAGKSIVIASEDVAEARLPNEDRIG